MNLRIDTSSGYAKGYTLEVQRYTDNRWKTNPRFQKFEHIGYMQCLFKSRKQACAYYDYWNADLRPINEHGTYCSSRNPDTNLRYIVRKFYRETQTIPPFDIRDRPVYSTSTKRGRVVAITTAYPSYSYLEKKLDKHIKLPKLV